VFYIDSPHSQPIENARAESFPATFRVTVIKMVNKNRIPVVMLTICLLILCLCIELFLICYYNTINFVYYFIPSVLQLPFSALTLLAGLQNVGCWFVGGDDLKGALHDL